MENMVKKALSIYHDYFNPTDGLEEAVQFIMNADVDDDIRKDALLAVAKAYNESI
jgi:hypothetical protein